MEQTAFHVFLLSCFLNFIELGTVRTPSFSIGTEHIHQVHLSTAFTYGLPASDVVPLSSDERNIWITGIAMKQSYLQDF